jgi:hypothetical protein
LRRKNEETQVPSKPIKEFANRLADELRVMGLRYGDDGYYPDNLGGQYRTLARWRVRHPHELYILFYTERYFGGSRPAYLGFASKTEEPVDFLIRPIAQSSYVKLTPEHWSGWDVPDERLKKNLERASYKVREDWRPRGWVLYGQYFGSDELDRALKFLREVIYEPRERPIADKSDRNTEGLGEVKTRRGQGDFRAEVIELWGRRCAITGCRIVDALEASHIDSWAKNKTDRLTAENGLPLVASAHRLFDQGLVSFNDDGRLVAKISDDDLKPLKMKRGMPLRERLTARQVGWMREHRRHHGFNGAT